MTEPTPKKSGMSGKVFVIGFALFCLLIAGGTLVATIVAQNSAPDDVYHPPEIGHELAPRGD